MDINEFLQRLDKLYEKMEFLEERFKLWANGEALSLCAHHILHHKIEDLINEYFTE